MPKRHAREYMLIPILAIPEIKPKTYPTQDAAACRVQFLITPFNPTCLPPPAGREAATTTKASLC